MERTINTSKRKSNGSDSFKANKFKAKPQLRDKTKDRKLFRKHEKGSPKFNAESENQDKLALSIAEIRRSVESLKEQKLEGPQTFGEFRQPDDTDLIIVTFETFKLPEGRQRTRLAIRLPHEYLPPNADVCLFIKDSQTSRTNDEEDDRRIAKYKEVLRKAGITQVTEVLSFKNVRMNFTRSKRRMKQLAKAFTLFVAEEEVMVPLISELGINFRPNTRKPRPIRSKRYADNLNNLQYEMKKVLKCSVGFLSSSAYNRGNECQTSYFTVGYYSMDAEKLASNIKHGVMELSTRIPGGKDNLRQILLQDARGGKMSIPIYKHPSFIERAEQKKTKKSKDNTVTEPDSCEGLKPEIEVEATEDLTLDNSEVVTPISDTETKDTSLEYTLKPSKEKAGKIKTVRDTSHLIKLGQTENKKDKPIKTEEMKKSKLKRKMETISQTDSVINGKKKKTKSKI